MWAGAPAPGTLAQERFPNAITMMWFHVGIVVVRPHGDLAAAAAERAAAVAATAANSGASAIVRRRSTAAAVCPENVALRVAAP
jgi:hypothetical protein